MPDSPITGLAAAGTIHTDDLLVDIDVHDTSMAPTGTNKKLTFTQLTASFTGDVTFVGWAGTIKTSVGLAGSPTTTTQTFADSSTKIATTAFVAAAVAAVGGSGTVSAGTAGQIAVYAGSGTTVSGESLATLATALNLSGTNTGDQDLSGLVVTSRTVNGHALSSNVTVSASDITTGTLPAAQLPNPSASTLGGIQSAAAVTHQWIASISTSGVPSLSQPAFTDISGTATAAQLPTTGLVITEHAAVVTTDSPSAGAVTSDLSVSDAHKITLAVSTLITLSNPASSKRQAAVLYLIQGGSGSCVPTFTPAVGWGAAGTPVWSTVVGKVDVVVLDWDGTSYRGAVIGLGF